MVTKLIRSTVDAIELEVVHPVYKTKTKKKATGEVEKVEVLDRELKIKKWFLKEAITSAEEYVDGRNRVSKSKCVVYDKYSSRFYAVWHSKDEVWTAKHSNTNNKSINTIGYQSCHSYSNPKTMNT